jgi:hypothetical protein
MDLLPPGVQVMPIDRSTIMTRLRVHSDLLADPESFIRERDLPIRTMKPTRGRGSSGPTRNLTLDVLTYRGIKVKLSKADGASLTEAAIDFNPGVCLRGHNGGILSLAEFLEALAVLVTHLKPLLNDPDDWVDLVPGLRRGGVAYWSELEVLFQFLDPDGTLLAGFRHARHPSITTPSRHWPTSIKMGGPRSTLHFSIYGKAAEMVAHGNLAETEYPNFKDVLRLEARMRKKKLVRYFGNARNVEVIDGALRLCRFYPQDLIVGYRKSFSEFQGLFTCPSTTTSAPEDKIKPVEALGRMLAKVALGPRTTLTLPELLSSLEFYTGAAIGEIRKAALAELSRRSSISLDDLFSDAAYRAEPGVYSEKREEKIRHDLDDLFAGRLITTAYQPPGLPFLPVTQFPRYARI